MAYWLVKTEPDVYSISDLKREKKTLWDGVRNYQARNYLRSMQVGELVLFYHSSCEEVGVAGIGKVIEVAIPEPLQFDKKSDYFDAEATKETPRWWAPRLEFVKVYPKVVPLSVLRVRKDLEKMLVLQRGSRLSVQPVTDGEFQVIVGLAEKAVAEGK
jgi:predicted RNA-binding protein with PUA-like domain